MLTDDEFIKIASQLTEIYMQRRVAEGTAGSVGKHELIDGKLIVKKINVHLYPYKDCWVGIAEDWPFECAAWATSKGICEKMVRNAVKGYIELAEGRPLVMRLRGTLQFKPMKYIQFVVRSN